MQLGVLGNAGSWYCRDLERAASERGHKFQRLDFPRLTASVTNNNTNLSNDDIDLSELDVVIVRTMPPGSLEQVVYRMDALIHLESNGVAVVNPSKSIECAVDKYLTTCRLRAANIPVPQTIVCENSEAAIIAFDTLGGDVVVKPLFGSEGRGIVRVSDAELALRTFRTLERIDSVLYIQEFVQHEGFDVRALVLDGTIIGGMKRKCLDDFRTNVSQNGLAERHELSDQEASLAIEAANATGARFAGVDLLYERSGQCFVIEVNAVPGWRAFGRVNDCDVALKLIQSLEN